MTVEGGLRERLISNSLHLYLQGCLSALGWLAPAVGRRDITYLTRPAAEGETITLNTIAVFCERVPKGDDLELGSTAEYNDWQWYADVYAEDESLSMHLAGDIRAILQGKMPSAGATVPALTVYDFTLVTPVPIAQCDIENVTEDRPPSFVHPWQQFWRAVNFTIVDVV